MEVDNKNCEGNTEIVNIMNIVRLGPDVELGKSLSTEVLRIRSDILTIAPMDTMTGDLGEVGYPSRPSNLAQWRQVAFHARMTKETGMPPQQAEAHAQQLEYFLGKVGFTPQTTESLAA